MPSRGRRLVSRDNDDADRRERRNSDDWVTTSDESDSNSNDDDGKDSDRPGVTDENGPKTEEALDNPEGKSFLDSPQVLWQETPVEQVLTYVGNVRNYHYYGHGRMMGDQDLSACLDSLDFTPNAEQNGLRDQKSDDTPNEVKPFACRSAEGCKCGLPSVSDLPRLYESMPTDDHIRLLEILPAVGGPLECRLHIAHLPDDKYTYEALSYTWETQEPLFGGQEPRATIKCNGLETSIGLNLASALHKLRSNKSSRMVWADALCINQKDVAERSHQVSRMSSIFENAFGVVVWLGQHAFPYGPMPHISKWPSYRAFSGICAVVNDWRERSGRTDTIPPASHSHHIHVQAGETDAEILSASSSLWFEIFELFKCGWFSRIWVIQELALARVATVLWDECEIPWEFVGLAAAVIRTNYDRISVSIRQRPAPAFFRQAPERRVPIGVANAYFIHRLSKTQSFSKPLEFTFHELLKLTRQFLCKDERDRVYGLLGLPTTDHVSALITPDYTKSAGEVYLDVAQKIMDSASSLAFLSSVQRKGSQGSMHMYYNPRAEAYDDKLPAWVPQWSYLITSSISPLHHHPSFNASGGRPLERKPSDDPRRLILRGVIVHEGIEDCSYPSVTEFWRGAARADRAEGVPLSRRSKVGKLRKRLERLQWTRADLEKMALTLTAGQNWYGLPVQDTAAHVADYARCLLKEGLLWSLEDLSFGDTEDLKANHKMFHRNTTRSPYTLRYYVGLDELKALSKGGNADRFLDTAATVGSRRARFTTRQGYIGIGPEAMTFNDRICILYGAQVPFVVRENRWGKYELIGECYIREAMSGEVVRHLDTPGLGLREAWIHLV